MARNYKKEYKNYQGTDKQKKRRASRNTARNRALKSGKVRKGDGKDIHHEVMKLLEESGLYLLCHVTSDEFNQILKDTHPEGHDPCEDAMIVTKIPF